MKNYAGFDVSLKEISICVVDQDGRVVACGAVSADPEGVAGWLKNRSLKPESIVHESGQLSTWLQRGLVRLGLPAICIDARKAHKSASARLNKSGTSDAEGLAQLTRTGWFTPVHVRSHDADRLRALVGARERLIRLRKDLEGHVRGVLKTFDIRMTAVGQRQQRQGYRDQLAAAGETDPVPRSIADGLIAAHSAPCKAAADLDRALKATSRSHLVARRLITIPGVGPIVSLSFVALVDDPNRFSKTSDVGAFLGLTPRRHQSGKLDWSDRVSKCRDAGSAVRGGVLRHPTGQAPLGAEIMGGLAGWAARVSLPVAAVKTSNMLRTRRMAESIAAFGRLGVAARNMNDRSGEAATRQMPLS